MCLGTQMNVGAQRPVMLNLFWDLGLVWWFPLFGRAFECFGCSVWISLGFWLGGKLGMELVFWELTFDSSLCLGALGFSSHYCLWMKREGAAWGGRPYSMHIFSFSSQGHWCLLSMYHVPGPKLRVLPVWSQWILPSLIPVMWIDQQKDALIIFFVVLMK